MAAKRVLFLAAEPSNEVRLRLGEEQRAIRNVLQMARARDSIEFHDRFAVRPADLTQALHDVRPNVVHFSGHGSSSGDLCFGHDPGVSEPVDPEALASVFRLVSDEVEAVVLNACYSEQQAFAIVRSIKYVIGMSDALDDSAAIRFSAGFYKALGATRTYADSFNFGVAEMRLHGMPDHWTPVLLEKPVVGPAYLRTDDRMDGATYARFTILKGRYGQREGPAVYVDPAQFSCLRSLIETLYRSYLRDRVAPFTYGTEWIITGDWNDHLLLAPAAWVKAPDLPARSAGSSWDESHALEHFGITPGTMWNVRLRDDRSRSLVEEPFAVASTDPQVLEILRSQAKGFVILRHRFTEAPTASQMEADSSSIVVLEDWAGSARGGRWFVDNGGDIPAEAQFYLRRSSFTSRA